MPITNLSNKRPPYVVFIKGTPSAFQALEVKDPNTLYYIAEKDSYSGSLYLGEILICSGTSSTVVASLKDLKDVKISKDLQSGSLLIYDGNKWVNETVQEVLESLMGIFIGATEIEDGKSGLVPAPKAGQEDYYLKGDGTWDKINAIIGKLDHKLTIGDKSFDGSEDVDVAVYGGEVIKDNVSTIDYSRSVVEIPRPMEMQTSVSQMNIKTNEGFQMTMIN